MCFGVVGIERDSLLQQFPRLGIVLPVVAVQQVAPLQQIVEGGQAGSRFLPGALRAHGLQPARERADDGLRHLVLHCEDVL